MSYIVMITILLLILRSDELQKGLPRVHRPEKATLVLSSLFSHEGRSWSIAISDRAACGVDSWKSLLLHSRDLAFK